MSAVYSLHLEPGPKVAGRPTSALHLRPRDGLRLGYRLALDDVSGLILKSESFSEDGKLLERHEYASISVTPKEDARTEESPTALMQHLDIVGLPFGYKASLARGFEEKALFVSDGIAAATVVFEQGFFREDIPRAVLCGIKRLSAVTSTRLHLIHG